MTDQSLFEDKQQQEQQQETPAQSDSPSQDSALEDLLKSIKNERGEPKYDSLPKALEGLRNAQEYIPSLKTELEQAKERMAQMEAQIAQQQKLEELVERLTASQSQQSAPTDGGLDEQKVQEMILGLLTQKESEKAAISNIQTVEAHIKNTYGDKASEVLTQKAAELGITLQEFKQLSAKSPKMVIELFKPQAPAAPKPNTSSVNSMSFLTSPQVEGLERPSKSLLAGASTQEQVEYMRKIREHVYKKHNVET